MVGDDGVSDRAADEYDDNSEPDLAAGAEYGEDSETNHKSVEVFELGDDNEHAADKSLNKVNVTITETKMSPKKIKSIKIMSFFLRTPKQI